MGERQVEKRRIDGDIDININCTRQQLSSEDGVFVLYILCVLTNVEMMFGRMMFGRIVSMIVGTVVPEDMEKLLIVLVS